MLSCARMTGRTLIGGALCALFVWSCSGTGGGGRGTAPQDAGLDSAAASGGLGGSTGGASASGGASAFGGFGGSTGGTSATGGVGGSAGATGGSGGSSATGGSGGSSATGGTGGVGGSGGASGGSGGSSATGGVGGNTGGVGGSGGASGGSGGSSASGGTGGTSGGCISGATGTHAARFRWAGNGSGSTAYVVYELNTLPDTSNWKVGAYSQSIGYKPVFNDVFLGVGGLTLSGTVFIDVDLSSVGLSSIKNVTLSIFGRSYNTTSSGSYSWQTFQGTGASPYGGVSNSAPYQWYSANATAAFTAGNGGIKLRIKPGGPSNSLIVNRVEICFDAT